MVKIGATAATTPNHLRVAPSLSGESPSPPSSRPVAVQSVGQSTTTATKKERLLFPRSFPRSLPSMPLRRTSTSSSEGETESALKYDCAAFKTVVIRLAGRRFATRMEKKKATYRMVVKKLLLTSKSEFYVINWAA